MKFVCLSCGDFAPGTMGLVLEADTASRGAK